MELDYLVCELLWYYYKGLFTMDIAACSVGRHKGCLRLLLLLLLWTVRNNFETDTKLGFLAYIFLLSFEIINHQSSKNQKSVYEYSLLMTSFQGDRLDSLKYFGSKINLKRLLDCIKCLKQGLKSLRGFVR